MFLSGRTAQATDHNTLVFRLQVACSRKENVPQGETDSDKIYNNHQVLSSHLKWEPKGEQLPVFASNPPAPTNPHIVLTKLRPGHEVDMELHAVKGIGRDHAKFSPVGMSHTQVHDSTYPIAFIQPRHRTAFSHSSFSTPINLFHRIKLKSSKSVSLQV